MTVDDQAIEAAARAICRRRLMLNQERGQLPVLNEASLQQAIDAAWEDYAEDARVAIEAAGVGLLKHRSEPEL